MLIKKRLRSVFPYFAFISAWIFLYHLPWQPAFVISLKNIKGTELRVTLQRSDGAKIIQTYHIPEKKNFTTLLSNYYHLKQTVRKNHRFPFLQKASFGRKNLIVNLKT